MPLYPYACTYCGAHRDELFHHANRPTTLLCTCGAEMALGLSATAPPTITGRHGAREGTRTSGATREGFTTTLDTPSLVVRVKGAALTLIDWRCPAAGCGHRFHDVYEERPDVAPPCPQCGTTTVEQIGVPDVDWFTKMYGASGGYFDQGLGCHVHSLAHRRKLMEERGLVEYGEVGEIHDDANRKWNERARKEDAVMRDMLRGYEHGPDAATMKLARDRGEVQPWQWAIDAVGGLDKEE